MVSRRRARRGFTLIEILIVIAIIGLLISLSIPAIQASRESARRIQCTNNQRQFGVAFTNFEAHNKAFPSCFTLRLIGPLTVNPELHMHNFMVDLLPFLEEEGVHSQYNYDAMYCAPENAAAIKSDLVVAICPSAPRSEFTPTTNLVPSLMVSKNTRALLKDMFSKLDKKYSTSFRGGVSDYAVVDGVGKSFARKLGYEAPDNSGGLPSMFPSPLKQPGLMASQITPIMNRPGEADLSVQLRATQITDGLSKTFMLTEAAGRPHHYRFGQRYPMGEPLESAWADPFITIRINGRKVGDEGNERCVLQCDNDDEIYSFHPAGVNFLFADGHVALLSADTEPRLLIALMTPDRGELIEGVGTPD